MKLHRNARSTPISRQLLVDRVLHQGWSYAAAAEAAGVSRRTVGKWVQRYRHGGTAALEDRSSRPGAPAHQTPAGTVGADPPAARNARPAGVGARARPWRAALHRQCLASAPGTESADGRAAGAGAALRMAGGRRHDSSRHQAPGPLPPSRTPGAWRSAAGLAGRRLGVRARGRRRSHAAGLRRGPARAGRPRCAGRFSSARSPGIRHAGSPVSACSPTTAAATCRACFAGAAPPWGCAIGARGRTRRAPTARPSASSKRCSASGRTSRPTRRLRSAGGRSAPGCSTTTASAHTPVSAISRRSLGCRELPDEQRV